MFLYCILVCYRKKDGFIKLVLKKCAEKIIHTETNKYYKLSCPKTIFSILYVPRRGAFKKPFHALIASLPSESHSSSH